MQQQQLAHYQQYLGMKEAMLKDTQGRFDKEEFRQWEEDYQQSGQFDHATMPLQGVSPSIFLQKNPVPGTETYDPKISSKRSGTQAEAREWIRQQAYTSEVFRIGLIKEFQALSPTDKAKYLDTDKSGTVSPQEAQAGEGVNVNKPDNPILRYALEKYTNTAIGVTALKPTKPSTGSSSKSSNKIELFGKWTDFAPGNQGIGTVKYKETPYADHIDFDGTFKLSNINSRDGLILRGETSKKITKAGVVEGTLKAYIPSEDVFVISAVGTDPDIDIGTLLEIPAKNLNQKEINKMPVIVNGAKTTLGSLRQTQTGGAVPTTTSAPAEGMKKKYFNSVTGKWGYK
jgi:hypothetical protein